MTTQPDFQWLMSPNEMMGRWANRVEVNIDQHGFTLDFFRIESRRNRGILVARVTISDMLATQLTNTLTGGLGQYAQRLVEEGMAPLAFDDDARDNGPDGTQSPTDRSGD